MAQRKRRPAGGSKKGSAKLKAGSAKPVSKHELAFNLKGIEAGGRKPRIPEGNYLAELKEATVGNTKKEPKRPMVLWIFTIAEGKYEGTDIWYRTVLQDNTLWDLRRTLAALGVKIKDETMKMDFRKLEGRQCGIQVIDGDPYNGKVSSDINDIFSTDLLEEDEEDDEDDFDDEEEEETEEDWEDDEEDEDEEEEEDDEDEGELYEEDELTEMSAQEVRAAGRQLGVVKKGMKKADIIEAILAAQEDSDDEEEWDDEVDLDDEDL